MTLAPGRQLGPYQILGPLGAGGMGEVYRARDPRLGRDVAIKVLPAEVSQDPNRLTRFEREVKALAALSHPNILVIHDFGRDGEVAYAVTELLEGETLRHRVAKGALPWRQAAEIGAAIADGLSAAHAAGIVHRDLKPENVFVTRDGRVKVLDFGLARVLPVDVPDPSASEATRAADVTLPGSIVGTPAYMCPEQARGAPPTPAADLWALGCILFEAVAGTRLYPGGSPLETIAAILEREPDWSALSAVDSAPFLDLLRRLLERDAGARPTAVEARDALEAMHAPAPAPLRRLTQVTFDDAIESSPVWSPDGQSLLFLRDAEGVRKIFRQPWRGGTAEKLTDGPHDDLQPCWAPDGRHIYFVRAREAGRRLQPGDVFGVYSDGDLWVLDLSTHAARRLIEEAFHPAMSADGSRLAFDASWGGPRRLWTADPNGRNPRQVTTDDSEAVMHLRPRWSPDGRFLVFDNLERTKFELRLVEIATGALRWLTHDLFANFHPVWSPSGRHVVFTSSHRGGGSNLWRLAVGHDGAPLGAPQPLTTGAGQDVEAAISADGSRVAFTILRQNADLWRLPVDPATGRVTGKPELVIGGSREESRGAWSPDQRRIAFNSDRTGEMNLWLLSLEDGVARPLTSGPGGDYQPQWSPDGSRLVFFSSREGRLGIWSVEVADGRLTRLTGREGIDVNPFYAPGGGRIAYQSDTGGRLEVWVMDADGSNPRQRTGIGVSGHFLRWSRDGRYIYFRCPSGSNAGLWRVGAEEGEPERMPPIQGGAHLSLSPDESRVMDVVAHKVLWVSPLGGGGPEQVFAFDDPEVRIDYPVWSPDGRWVLFDRFQPQGGDVWVLDGLDA